MLDFTGTISVVWSTLCTIHYSFLVILSTFGERSAPKKELSNGLH